MSTYKELREKTAEELSQEQLLWDIQDNKLQLEADVRATERQLLTEEVVLTQLKSRNTLSTQDIISQMDVIKGLRDGLGSIKELLEELFPEDNTVAV